MNFFSGARLFWGFMAVIVAIFLLSKWSKHEFAAPQFPSCSSQPTETTRQRACRQACEVIDECGYYMTNEADRVMSIEDCEHFCTFLPDAQWAECTLAHHLQVGCCGKKFGVCAEHLPSPR